MNFNSLRKEITSNNASVKELVNDIFANIDHKDPEINSFITILEENSLKNAKKIDEKLSKKDIEHSFITGIPIMLKDNIATKGIKNIHILNFLI